jgi:hypothetical protein
MALLSTSPHPLPPNQPPPGYAWEERDMSVLSTTTAFNTRIDQRDTFLGEPRCIICGSANPLVLQHCQIIRELEPETVSRTAICTRLRLILKHSGPISRPAVGFLCRTRPIPAMNPAMVCLCVLTITSYLMDMPSSYVSSPM